MIKPQFKSYTLEWDDEILCDDRSSQDSLFGEAQVYSREEVDNWFVAAAASRAPSDAESDRDDLAREIVLAAKRLHITNAETPMTGPEVLLMLQEIEVLAAGARAVPETQEMWGVWIHGELCVAFPSREQAVNYDARGEIKPLICPAVPMQDALTTPKDDDPGENLNFPYQGCGE